MISVQRDRDRMFGEREEDKKKKSVYGRNNGRRSVVRFRRVVAIGFEKINN